ncbi:MAG TPA: sigma-54 dependent transcriptional regulator [Blastocatellia bacterium]|jgi:two-component system response regulator AtoC|nr:sigma-54 dependent transcriptional regulator [Blastocatellia bacterium]
MLQAPQILVADDDRLIRLTLEAGLSLYGFRVSLARSGREALQAALEKRFDGIISDVYMADGDGLMVLRELRSSQPETPIILMTAVGSVNLAVRAIEEGATDFIAKPFEVEALADLLHRHLRARVETGARPHSPEEEAGGSPSGACPLVANEDDFSGSGLIGRSPAMVKTYKLIAHAARIDATVLITGESGAGKELAARAIHDFSARRDKPFIAINCSGLTDTLLEAELFGHAKGAFTGAIGERAGLFEAADGGTLFLDELASTSAAFQASLLRVLQSGEARRVGSTQIRRVNVRVIGATNMPLRELAERGKFRSDLYYRLSVLTIDLPPLRERMGDVELLAQHFLRKLGGETAPAYLTREALDALRNYHFPGNVRELENALTRAVALATNGPVTLDCLPPHIAETNRKQTPLTDDPMRSLAGDWPSLDELQRRYLALALEKNQGNRQRTADLLGITRRTIQRLIARYNLNALNEAEIIDGDHDFKQ